MSSPSNETTRQSLLARVTRALNDWWSATSDWPGGLEGCPSREVDRIARDLSLSRNELLRLAAMKSSAADELYRRLAVLDVDAGALQHRDPTLMRELGKTCSFCTSKARCSSDLNWCPDAPDWTEYCPNAAILQSLRPSMSIQKA